MAPRSLVGGHDLGAADVRPVAHVGLQDVPVQPGCQELDNFAADLGTGFFLVGRVKPPEFFHDPPAFGGVRLPTASWALLLLIVALCAIPFGAVGLAVGQMLGPNSAAGLINAIYLPMSFLSGLWIPLQVLPKFLQTMAPIWPSFHASQLTLRAVGGSFGGSVTESAGVAIAALVATSVVGFSVTILLSRRAAAKTWG